MKRAIAPGSTCGGCTSPGECNIGGYAEPFEETSLHLFAEIVNLVDT
jgi:hypothetical protein